MCASVRGVMSVTMKTIVFLFLTLMHSICIADYSMDFYRYQCVPALGTIYLDTFTVSNPDKFGTITNSGSNEETFSSLVKEHDIYVVQGKRRVHECSIGDHSLRLIMTFTRNSQGQSGGIITVESGSEEIITNLDLFAYYGYAPLVKRIQINLGYNDHSNLLATFYVIGERNRPNFSFSTNLTAKKPMTRLSLQDEAKKHP